MSSPSVTSQQYDIIKQTHFLPPHSPTSKFVTLHPYIGPLSPDIASCGEPITSQSPLPKFPPKSALSQPLTADSPESRSAAQLVLDMIKGQSSSALLQYCLKIPEQTPKRFTLSLPFLTPEQVFTNVLHHLLQPRRVHSLQVPTPYGMPLPRPCILPTSLGQNNTTYDPDDSGTCSPSFSRASCM